MSSFPDISGKSILPTTSKVQIWQPITAGNIDPSKMGVSGPDAFQNNVKVTTKLGYGVIASPSTHWYLDCSPAAAWCADKDSTGAPIHHTWQKVYSYLPRKDIDKPELVLGGEGCLWTETVKLDVLDWILWPRSAALAERLWSGDSIALSSSTAQRLQRVRESLINEMKVGAQAIDEASGKMKQVYRPEWYALLRSRCDFNLDTPAQKTFNKYSGMSPSSNDYCEPASAYVSEDLVYKEPARVEYKLF